MSGGISSKTHIFNKRQEIANAASHTLGIAFSIIALVVLIVVTTLHGNAWHVVSVSIYGATMLTLYVCSTLLHSLPRGRAKNVFEILDHASIYAFIAGTYTPILLIVVGGWKGWILLASVWLIAAGGIVFKVYYVQEFVILSTIGYILMGCLTILVVQPILHTLPAAGIVYLFGGGLLYIVGSVFYVWRKLTYHHTIWHLFVLGGSALHFILVLGYVTPIHR